MEQIEKLSQKIPIHLDNLFFQLRVLKYKYFPRLIQIETTNRCNAKCFMCPRGMGLMKRPIGTMSMVLFKKIIDECKQHREIKKILLYVDGEPLMDELLIERIKYIKDICSRLYVQISTNASLLTRKKAKEILSAKPDMIIISLDGANKETYEKVRGLNYDKIVRNIMNLIDIKKELTSHTKLVVRMLKTKLTYFEVDKFKSFWKNKNVDVKIKLAHNFNFMDIHFKKNQRLVPCEKLWRALSIYWDGNVPLCCRDFNKEVLLGNINNQNIKDIWKGKILSNVRKSHLLRINLKDLNPCKRCDAIKKSAPAFLF